MTFVTDPEAAGTTAVRPGPQTAVRRTAHWLAAATLAAFLAGGARPAAALGILVPPSVVFVLCIAALFAHQSSRALDQALLERGRTMVRFLAPAAEYVLVSGNREALGALMARGLAQPDVVGVGFYDPGGEALAMLGEGLPPRLAAPVRAEGDEIRVELADGAVGFEAAVVVVPAAVDDYAEDPPL